MKIRRAALFLISMAVGCELTGDGRHFAKPENVRHQERMLDEWVDALTKAKTPFRLFKIIGSGCFVGTWGYNGYGGPGLAMSPNQAACDDPANAGITTVFQLTGSSTLPAKTPTSGAL